MWVVSKYMGHQNIQGASKHTGSHPNIWRHPNIPWVHPNIQGASKHMGAYKCIGSIWTPPWCDKACFLCVVYVQQASKHHPNIQGAIQTYGGYPNIQGASKCIGAYGHTLSLTNHAFFVLCMYRGHPNIIKTYRGHPNIYRASKHMGVSKHTGGIPACLPISQSGFYH